MSGHSTTSKPDLPHARQIEAWRHLGETGRIELAAQLQRKVRGWKADALRQQHPDWAEDRVRREVARLFICGNT
jgi:hypothetical protein